MEWISWFITAIIWAGAIMARLTMKTWFAPAPFFFLYWSVFTITPMICASGYPVYWSGILYILCTCIIFFTGGLISDKVFAPIKNTQIKVADQNYDRTFQYLSQLIIICALIGFISFGYMCYELFKSIEAPITIEKIDALHREIRWSSQYSPPILSRVLNSFIYFGGLLGGINFVVSKSWRKKALSFSPFAVAFLYTVVLTTKSAVLYPAVLFASSSIALLFYKDKYRASLYYFKYFIIASLTAIVCMAFIADKIRGATNGDFLSLWEYLKPSFFGYISTFSTWFNNNWRNDFTPTFGAYSLSGVFDALGIKERLSGIYREEIMLGKQGSNVYTVFRGLIQDFTLIGSFIVTFTAGFSSHYFFSLMIGRSRIAVAFLSGFYAFVLWGFVVSIFNYNSIILSYILLFLYLSFIDLKNKFGFMHSE